MSNKTIQDFLQGKTPHTLGLYKHFVDSFATIGVIALHPAKTMIGIDNGEKRIAWITQFGEGFLHVVFPFKQSYADNLCFIKIAQVPGTNQYNHHFRMLAKEDVTEEVLAFMRLAFAGHQ